MTIDIIHTTTPPISKEEAPLLFQMQVTLSNTDVATITKEKIYKQYTRISNTYMHLLSTGSHTTPNTSSSHETNTIKPVLTKKNTQIENSMGATYRSNRIFRDCQFRGRTLARSCNINNNRLNQ